jgi:glycosyltransferase involved in cell wall biosynthesis
VVDSDGRGKAKVPRSLQTVSVVVPTRNRAPWLGYLFDSLSRQAYPSRLVEIVIVDNSSTDNTEEVVRQWSEVLPFEIRFVRKQNKGPASSRNYGVVHSTGEILAFTDSDCMPDPRWLLNGVGALGSGIGLVTGPIYPRRTDDTHFFFNAQLAPVLRDTGVYRTANLIVPRYVFDQVHGFDEGYALARGGALLGGEDTDLGWRIKRRGYVADFRPDVIVIHIATPISVRDWVMRPQAVQVIPKLVRSIPELRKSVLWHRYFLSKLDFMFLLGLAGLLAAFVLHWWPLALLPVGFLWTTRNTYAGMVRKRRFDKALVMAFLLWTRSALNVFVLAGASARYRRLVL